MKNTITTPTYVAPWSQAWYSLFIERNSIVVKKDGFINPINGHFVQLIKDGGRWATFSAQTQFFAYDGSDVFGLKSKKEAIWSYMKCNFTLQCK